ncbi:MAG: SPFH domain-containing protein, partial [Brevundimonas sp.]|nr:SPFH domain-containing protein [Brevundimonas sp.]
MAATHSKSTERPAATANGILMLLLGLLLMIGGPAAIAQDPDNILLVVGGVLAAVVGLLLVCGLYSLQPNESMAILLFGDYRGTDRKTGLRWVLPWYSRKKI